MLRSGRPSHHVRARPRAPSHHVAQGTRGNRQASLVHTGVYAHAHGTPHAHTRAHTRPMQIDEPQKDTTTQTRSHARTHAERLLLFTLPRRFDWLLRAMCRGGLAVPGRARTPSQRRAGPDTVEASATRLSRCSPPRSRRRALRPPSTTAPSPPRRRRGHLPELTQVPRWGSGGHRRHWNASAACPPRRCRGL